MIRSVMTTIKVPDSLFERIDLMQFSKYLTLIRITCRILAMYKYIPKPSLFNALVTPVRDDYNLAVKFWIYHLQSTTRAAPSGPFNEPVNMRQRFALVQSIADCFWKKMTKDFFPSLIIRGKWHVQRRNVMVGDIVIVQDANVVRSEWKIARVSKVFPDNNGVVRRCEV